MRVRAAFLFVAAVVAFASGAGSARAENVFLVNSGGDGGDVGAASDCNVRPYPVGTEPECTLRAAIEASNANDQVDVIRFDPAIRGTIVLSGGALSIADDVVGRDVSIEGPGARSLTVSGNDASRVLDIFAEAQVGGLTISGGNVATQPGSGAGIRNAGKLTLGGVTVAGNAVAAGGSGGAGISNSGDIVINDSSVVDNSGPGAGGGLHNTGTATVVNTTFSGNRAGTSGGGIYNAHALTMQNGTVTDNDTAFAGDAGGEGGGIYIRENTAISTELQNTIVAGNRAGTGGPDVRGTFTSGGFNLIGSIVGAGGFASTDQVNRNPRLGLLRNNGGPTNTHALLKGSPAIDRGSRTDCPAADQRGVVRPQNGDGKRGKRCDVGAYELKPKRR